MKHRILYMMIMAAAIFSCQKAEEKAEEIEKEAE